ncbi:MAG: ABC transporter permease [Spirochaetia bacterium]|mgnify:FL=1|jgi:simple sugar transport system permease protein|uniref:Branched-chain amino acid transport system / permease component n=1 Tax=bioreactor metagenome TaxID=1076179 RepID=A0A644TTZ7_9ZZZZ|nr:ABC transporter permease [Spirochaetia bacterium]MCE1209450.1 ABC transporter permease [Spirochaetia bacterium]NLX44816.1 ABC transporter permease [Treponema sp.]
MTGDALLFGLSGVLSSSAPILFGVLGETISERAGVSNLAMNGMILLSAMGGFAASLATGSLALGFLAGAAIGAAVALVVAFASISLRQSQVAVGYVLAMLCRDLAYFLGNPIMGMPGPRLNLAPIPALSSIPILGTLLFRHDIVTYSSFLLIILSWFYMERTKPGIMLKGLGENPRAAYVRGADVNRLRYLYTVSGGAIAGLAGPIYSLSVKAGWKGTISGLDGIGWIILSITIFGGWRPFRAAMGAYFFSFLQWLGLVLQPLMPNVPSQVLQVAPFPLMILTLLLVNIGNAEWVERSLSHLPESVRRDIARVLGALNATPPAALGQPFDKDE